MMFDASNYHLVKTVNKRAFETGYPDNPLTLEDYNDWRSLGNTVGIMTGVKGGIYVVDVDDIEKATETLLRWELPATLLVKTPSGGYHYYFRYDGEPLPRKIRPFPGIDLLGKGGYANCHLDPKGNYSHYQVEHIAQMPENLLSDWRQAASEGRKQDGHSNREGARNETLASFCGSWFKQGMPYAQVMQAAQTWGQNCIPPMDPNEVANVVNSVSRYHAPGAESKEPDGPLPLESFFEMCQRADQMTLPEPVIAHFVTGTWGVIYGPPGSGKSLAVGQLVRAIATGGKWCDFQAEKPRKVALIDAEMTPYELAGRIGAAEIPNLYVSTLDLMERKGREAFYIGGDQADQKALMEACKDFDVIVIDNIEYTLMPADDKDIHHAETWKRVHPLLSWAKGNGKLLILVDHSNAQGNLMGSLSKQRGASFTVKVTKSWRKDTEVCFEWKPEKTRYQADRKLLRLRSIYLRPNGEWYSQVIKNNAEEIIDLIEAGYEKKEIVKEMKGICTPRYVRDVWKQYHG